VRLFFSSFFSDFDSWSPVAIRAAPDFCPSNPNLELYNIIGDSPPVFPLGWRRGGLLSDNFGFLVLLSLGFLLGF